jgi:hypothetical protein
MYIPGTVYWYWHTADRATMKKRLIPMFVLATVTALFYAQESFVIKKKAKKVSARELLSDYAHQWQTLLQLTPDRIASLARLQKIGMHQIIDLIERNGSSDLSQEKLEQCVALLNDMMQHMARIEHDQKALDEQLAVLQTLCGA